MISEYLAGNSAISIAEKYGVTKETVYRRLRKMGNWNIIKEKNKVLKMKKRLEKYEPIREEVYRLAEAGEYRRVISKSLGISLVLINELLRGTKYDTSLSARLPLHNEIRRDYGRGMDRQELMEKYELSYPHICRIINKYNIK